ncbi:MAG TPA: WYL domain-containing protein [Ktedonobacterales bacterium]|nr:WYL domain-containing protein [Ktedonobacterales bacterium]
MNRIDRLTGILLLLQRHPRTADEIARRFEVSKRTVVRDMWALREIGVPIFARDGAKGGYSLPVDYRLAPLPLTPREMFLLLLALDAIDRHADVPFAQERTTLRGKLHALLPDEELAQVERWLRATSIAVPKRRQHAPLLDALIEATGQMGNQRWLRITYQSAHRRAFHTIYPREVFAQQGFWYCNAYVYETGAERMYRVDRIVVLGPADDEKLPEHPPLAPPYDDDAHPLIVATLTASGAARLESEPHLGQILMRQADGGATLSFRCPPGELDFYARLFAMLGCEAKVHEPLELREQLRLLGKQIADHYRER